MHVRRMIANAGYSPPAVAGLTQAFDDAWEEISLVFKLSRTLNGSGSSSPASSC